MGSEQRPTEDDHREAIRIALSGIASGIDLAELLDELEPLHPKRDTFPGEVLLELGADALEQGGVTRTQPVDFEDIRERYLPEREFRGKIEHHRSKYALQAVPMIAAGVTPDLSGETGWWQINDLWIWSVYALVIYVRIASERTGDPVGVIASRIAERRNVDLTSPAR